MSSNHATVSTEPLRVIQFPHPGFEYTGARYLGPKKQRTGVMEWKEEGTVHNRKYLVASGSAVDPTTSTHREGVKLGFWGEWEAPSQWRRADGPVEPYHPSVFHEPLLPAERPAGSHQNTDPLVFGDRFLYTNCRMGIRPLRGIPSGSLILFGRSAVVNDEPAFALDTCFVVDHRHDRITTEPGEARPWGEDLLTDMVIAPLQSGAAPEKATSIHHYVGRQYTPGMDSPYSFFPAVLHDDTPEGFARPVLEPTGLLADLINPNLRMSVRTRVFSDPGAVRDIWQHVVDRVTEAGCVLGVHATPPARGES